MTLGTRWGYFYREELSGLPVFTDHRAGRVGQGAFLLAPPFVELTLTDGLWSYVNQELGTLFDYAEEEVVEPDVGKRLSIVMRAFARDHYARASGTVRKAIGSRDGVVVSVQMRASEVSAIVDDLSAFIAAEATAGHTIIGAL